MELDLPDEAYEHAATIESKLGETFSIHDLIKYVSGERNKKIVMGEKLIHTAFFGVCFSFINCDLIIMVPGLSKRLYIFTIIHELIHVLRNEAVHYNKIYDRELHNNIFSYEGLHRGAAVLYEDLSEETKRKEDIAESTATLIFGHVWRDEESIPAMVQRIYGYRE